MNVDELEHGLDRWGSDLESWPDEERKAALALLERSERARALLVHGRALDGWLDEGRTHRAPAQLKQKILAQLPRADIWQRAADWFASALWRPALAGACALALAHAGCDVAAVALGGEEGAAAAMGLPSVRSIRPSVRPSVVRSIRPSVRRKHLSVRSFVHSSVMRARKCARVFTRAFGAYL